MRLDGPDPTAMLWRDLKRAVALVFFCLFSCSQLSVMVPNMLRAGDQSSGLQSDYLSAVKQWV